MLDTRGPHCIALCTCGQEAKRNNEVGCRVHGLHTILCSQVSWVDITSSFLPMILRRLQHLEPTLATHSSPGLAPPAPPQMPGSHSRFSSVQFSSVAQSCPTLCDPMDCSTPGLPVHRQLLEFTQTHVHRVSDASQPSHPLSSPSPPAFNLSQHQGLFNESVLHIRWPKYRSFNFSISPSNEYSGLISLGWTALISLQSKGLSRFLSNTIVQKHQFFSAQLSLQSNSHIHK